VSAALAVVEIVRPRSRRGGSRATLAAPCSGRPCREAGPMGAHNSIWRRPAGGLGSSPQVGVFVLAYLVWISNRVVLIAGRSVANLFGR
jgi:hypothetical protein